MYQRFWNTIKDWDKDAYNNFETAFAVNDQLASCPEVWVYINDVKIDQEIVVDDLQIAAYSTLAPTISPTPGATEFITSGETDSPTVSPSSMPTTSTLTSCPDEESTPTEIPSGAVMLKRSSTVCVLTKAVPVNGTLTSVAPVAISYEDRLWEKAAGEFAMRLLYDQEFGDFSDRSHITLPAGHQYYLTSYSHTASDDATVARFLETATFGTTAQDLANFGTLTSDSFKTWIQSQISLPVTSHREFFRKRVNPRVSISSTFCSSVFILSNKHTCFALLVTPAYKPCTQLPQQSPMRCLVEVANLCVLKEGGRSWRNQ